MTAIAVPLLWRYHARSLASGGAWAVRIALLAPVGIGGFSILLSGGDAGTYRRWLSDEVLPLLAAITVAAALWPEARSGALRTWAVSPDRTGFRWLIQRVGLAIGAMAGLVLAGMLLGTIVNLLLGILPQPVLDPGFFGGYLFMAALTLTGALLFRHPIGGVALAGAYWLIDLRLGVAGNPLLTLHATTAQVDGKGSPVSDWFNKPALLALSALMVLWCSGAMSRLVVPMTRRESPRLAGFLVGGFFLALMAQVALSVGMLYLTRRPAPQLRRMAESLNQGVRQFRAPEVRGTTIRSLAAPVEAFKPLPISLLFGPVYHGLVTLPPPSTAPASGGAGPAEAMAPRIAALSRLVHTYGALPWADTAAYELAIARSQADGVKALQDYWDVAERYPNSPYAVDSLAAMMNTREAWVLAKPPPNSKNSTPYSRAPNVVPLQVRLSAAIALIQRFPSSAPAAQAREMALEYYPALIRPEVMSTIAPKAVASTRGPEKARWLAILAEIELNAGRYAEAETALKEARKEAGPVGAGVGLEDGTLMQRLGTVEQMLEHWRSKQSAGAGQ